ncbi:zonular occludens toxin domain-containing protein [Moritella sp. F3]|uniref:zonular occludens toxin domain-containing protein n=1 Tax=Moritella sp. F3 TaxID=2718882 RepID=UPI0018E1A59C|nr:zonular occludens toxin domain-containing protein [Moritella sp. F3]GIC79359.1 hypothetical protein FMO001_40860 [Moritella sp. F1]GIC84078.1 hypothetical protein FMO003_43580 [Moritella sp. F3]
MASLIFHGNPGSYKTSTALWFEMLPALRAGRCVVTNIEGLFGLNTIEKAVGEKFPKSAQLWRISTLNQAGVDVLARWFHWLPAGALLLIDEVQNLYSDKDRTELKEFNVSLDGEPNTVDIIKAVAFLPVPLCDYAISVISEIKPDGYTDDLGLTETDDNGHIRYPRNIKDALMRHRKFNWDILVCTPDITKVHNLIRSVAEQAVSHKSFDFAPMPYFQRRPRTHEHNPLERGLSPKKGEQVKRRKIPLDVFKLYKSTQTGKNNKNGKGSSPFQSPKFVIAVVCLLSILAYFIWFAVGRDGNSPSTGTQQSSEQVHSVDDISTSENTVVTGSDTDSIDSDDSNAVIDETVDVEPEPLIGFDFYVTGFTKQVKYSRVGQQLTPEDFLYLIYFDVYKDGQLMFKTTNTDLNDLGYTTKTLTECVYKLSYQKASRIVTCKEDDKADDVEEDRDDFTLDESLLASAPSSFL